jgi:hypothetical protein
MALSASKSLATKTGDPSKEDVLRSFIPKPSRGVNMREATKERKGQPLGRLQGVTGTTGSGKSSFLQSAGWTNLKYKTHLDNDQTEIHFPKTIKLLQKGIIPEIEHIGIVESDMKSIDDAVSTEWKSFYGPLIEDGVYDVSECFIISREEKTKNGKVIKSYDPIIEQEREEYMSAVMGYEKNPDIQMVGLDNASDLIGVLESTAENVYPDKETWFWYNKRKKWFFDFLAVAKASKKMHILIFRLKEQLDFLAKARLEAGSFDHVFEEPWYKMEWAGEVGYKLDNFYLFKRNYVLGKFSVTHKKGCWPMLPSTLEMPHDPFMYQRVLEASADVLLQEYDPDKFKSGGKFW